MNPVITQQIFDILKIMLGYQQFSHRYILETLSALKVLSKLCLEALSLHMHSLDNTT